MPTVNHSVALRRLAIVLLVSAALVTPTISSAQIIISDYCIDGCNDRLSRDYKRCDDTAELTTSQIQAEDRGAVFVLVIGGWLITKQREDCRRMAAEAFARCAATCNSRWTLEYWNYFDWGMGAMWMEFQNWWQSSSGDTQIITGA